MSRFTDTIAALATPVGTAALAIIRVSGPDTERLLREIWSSPPPSARRVRHGDYRNLRGELVDDVLFAFFRGPRSYTGEDSLELSCHGNPFIVRKVLDDLLARGCRPAEPGEFTQRAFLNGRIDLTQAEAVIDLIHARSDRALAAANDQLRGALGRRMAGLIDRLLEMLARVEAYIDFPDEDLPSEDKGAVLTGVQQLIADTDSLLATNKYSDLLRDGIKTVIVGKPNVGKSSLLNRLVGHERALVSAEPGTTRDYIEERLIAGPHCLRLIDTAGLNPSPAALEKLGMEKTLERAGDASLFLIVLDEDATRLEPPKELLSRISAGNSVYVLNKSDLRSDSAPLDGRSSPRHVLVSAKTGEGIKELTEIIVTLADSITSTMGSDSIVINARHAHALDQAGKALHSALGNLKTEGPTELLASDLRAALNAYGEIAGKVDNERMLDQLFASFCIGK
jgi:tRNA modification GTPase